MANLSRHGASGKLRPLAMTIAWGGAGLPTDRMVSRDTLRAHRVTMLPFAAVQMPGRSCGAAAEKCSPQADQVPWFRNSEMIVASGEPRRLLSSNRSQG
jgi:hypothetical protein